MSDSQTHILVFDVGGSHIASALFNTNNYTISRFNRVSSPEDGDPEQVFAGFQFLKEKTSGDSLQPGGIAVAVPNPFDYGRGISYMRHKFRLLYGADLRKELSQRLQCDARLIHFLNDAASSLIGELHKGAARGVSRAVGVTLGTGVGSAFAVGGEIVVEGPGVPPGGEIWNLPYGDSIVEDAVSTRAIQRLFEALTGTRSEVSDIAALGKENAAARLTFDRFGRELGKVLRHTCLAFAPERIIIGGGIARAAALFQPALDEELAGLSLCVSELFDRAPLVGAGISWMREYMLDSLAPTDDQTRTTVRLDCK